ncbi:hypothetical protein GCM10010387_49060 [Streptomyces inusitatus]|uniref:DUF4440 domain-containing protein n=1 Tax=Streptomyces inusitatus TaxID=68221 RepID=A0A918QHV7_9ACTN|nr:SgcJ/EcaC family oxidoreductase [Streptomyces inusitatus]GGZ48852.1 hypothetical protein GCM10010387_49060 [Streptomyces inusitatus]
MSASTSNDTDIAAIAGVPGRIVAAWADNDADAFAEVFAEDSTLILPGDVFLRGREEVRAFMTRAYQGPFKGTRVFGEPLSLRRLAPDVAMVITKGGVLAPGDTEVAPERAIRAGWLLTRHDGEWLITAYQNTPIGTA